MEKRERSASLQAFAEELEQYEKMIAQEVKSPSGGWKPWRGFRDIPALTPAEKQKASLIQRFVFPSDRESLMEALLYVKEQTAVLASGCPNPRTWYWAQLWGERAGQLYEKVKILAGEDASASQALEAYGEIVRNEKKIKRLIRLRRFLTGGLVLALLCAGFILISWEERTEKEPTEKEQTAGQQTAGKQTAGLQTAEPQIEEWQMEGQTERGQDQTFTIEHFTFSIPRYWKEEGSKGDYYQYYAETGGKVAMLSIGCPVDDEPVTLDALYADNENMVEMIESWFPECQVTGYEDFASDYGVKGILYSYQAVVEEAGTRHSLSGKSFCFPSVEDNRWFLVLLNTSDNTRFQYDEEFLKVLASIRQTLH